MSDEEKIIRMYEVVEGKLKGGSCHLEYNEDEKMLHCMKDGNSCWSISKADVLFNYVTRGEEWK